MIYQASCLHLLRLAGGLAEQAVEKGSGAVILRSPSADGLRTRAPQKSPRHESGAVATNFSHRQKPTVRKALTVATNPAEAEPWFRPRTNRGPTCLRPPAVGQGRQANQVRATHCPLGAGGKDRGGILSGRWICQKGG
jgi:hypothetical protein